MDNLKDFLAKFKKLIDHSGNEKKIIIVAVKKYTNVSLDEKDIAIQEAQIRITSHPAIKSEIYMKKSIILSDINATLAPKTFKDIR